MLFSVKSKLFILQVPLFVNSSDCKTSRFNPASSPVFSMVFTRINPDVICLVLLSVAPKSKGLTGSSSIISPIIVPLLVILTVVASISLLIPIAICCFSPLPSIKPSLTIFTLACSI